jgi:hypothetical protein
MEIEQIDEEGSNYEVGILEEPPQQYETSAERTDIFDQKPPRQNSEGKRSFIHGLAVGLGIGCIATFVIMWITIFFTPLLPQTATYENLLAVFIYPLLYLLIIGLVALTAGVVREYYAKTNV